MNEDLTPMYGLMEDIILGLKCFMAVLVLGAAIAAAFAILIGCDELKF